MTWKSINFDERSLPVSMLVLHYTGMENRQIALEQLCSPAAKVSTHYLVDEQGEIVSLVPEEKRSWHAGLSHWRGCDDVNSASIGIEIVNGGHDFGLPPFPASQVKALIGLCQDILRRHDIPASQIVGHNEIAPDRKLDPGEKFPWDQLAKAGIGFYPDKGSISANAKPDAKTCFQTIGYDLNRAPISGSSRHCLTAEFQRRYRPTLVNGTLDEETLDLLQQVASQYQALTSAHKTG